MDIKTVFLYSDIKEDIWINLPIGYNITKTAKLKKALYRLKQAPCI
jgi:Reverse transcriptase (RNA-dependent DNA polymerase)